jgi:L-amino acid N-acyltransferase YncA
MRTPPEFREEHVLADGTRVALRHIRPADADELRRGFEQLSPESRYRRFFGGMAQLSDEMLRYLTEVDGTDHVAIVASAESPDLKTERGLGVARFVRLADRPTVAEAAVTVVDDAQHKGLGRLLTMTLADAARERGVKTFRADVLSDNAPMRAMMREIGAVEQASAGGMVSYDIPLGDATHEGVIDVLMQAAATGMAFLVRRLGAPDVPTKRA